MTLDRLAANAAASEYLHIGQRAPVRRSNALMRPSPGSLSARVHRTA